MAGVFQSMIIFHRALLMLNISYISYYGIRQQWSDEKSKKSIIAWEILLLAYTLPLMLVRKDVLKELAEKKNGNVSGYIELKSDN